MENMNEAEIEIIDFRDYLKILSKWKVMIIGITILAIVTSAVLSYFVLPPVYKTNTILMVTQSQDTKKTVVAKDNLEDVVNTISRLPEMTINTYVGQVKSDAILNRVMSKLKLDPKLYSIAALRKMIDVQAVKDSNLIEVDVENTDPKLAADIANTLADEFLLYISEKNEEQMTRSVQFLEKQIGMERKNMNNAILRLELFQSQPRGIDVLKQEMNAKLTDLTKYQSFLQQIQLEYQQAAAGKTILERQLAVIPKTVIIKKRLAEDPSLYGTVYMDRVQPNMTVTSEEVNSEYQRVNQELSTKTVDMSEKKAQLDGTSGIVAALQNDIKGLQKELTQKQTQLDTLQNDVDRYKTTFNLLQEKITQTQIAKSINLGETSLLISSPALNPDKPIKPKKMLNIAMAAVLGLFVSFSLAILLEKLDNTFKTPQDAEALLGVPVIGSIPVIDL